MTREHHSSLPFLAVLFRLPMISTRSLADVLPWRPGTKIQNKEEAQSILVTDTVSNDGRFLLYAHTSAILQQQEASILWLSGGPWTISLIEHAVEQYGGKSGTSGRDPVAPLSGNQIKNLSIRSLAVELAEQQLEGDISTEHFLRTLLKDIRKWVQDQEKNCWILLDDLTALSSMLQSTRLVYALVLSLQALSNTTEKELKRKVHILMRCGTSHIPSVEGATPSPASTEPIEAWLGDSATTTVEHEQPPLDVCLTELVNWIVDVTPLVSGPTREAHGRLTLLSKQQEEYLAYNYRLSDDQREATVLPVAKGI